MFQATVTRDEIIHCEGTRQCLTNWDVPRTALLSHFDETNRRRRPALPLCQQDLSRCDIRILEHPCHGYLGTTVIGHWAWPVSLSRRSAVTSAQFRASAKAT